MPGGIDGGELASRLEARQPDVKIVFTSGYSGAVAGLDLEHRTFVHKPVVPERLLETVRSCLDRPA
jgi:two-component system, cell cycle sensor histidine kinase and response regulator CckA